MGFFGHAASLLLGSSDDDETLCVNLVQYSISNIMEVVEVLLRTLLELMKDRPCHMKRTLDDDFQGSFFVLPLKNCTTHSIT